MNIANCKWHFFTEMKKCALTAFLHANAAAARMARMSAASHAQPCSAQVKEDQEGVKPLASQPFAWHERNVQ